MDQSLGDLKNMKFSKKKTALKSNSNFFYSDVPSESRTSFFVTFCVLGIQN